MVDTPVADAQCQRLIGAIAVHASDPPRLSGTAQASAFEVARLTAQGVGAWIQYNRTARHFAALNAFQSSLGEITDPIEACSAACRIIKEWASADQCCIFAPSSQGTLVRLADAEGAPNTARIDPTTLTATILYKRLNDNPPIDIYRLANILDDDERFQVFGPAPAPSLQELPLNTSGSRSISTMFMLLTCSGITSSHVSRQVPFLLIRLFTCQKPGFEGGHFSTTDEHVLRSIGQYLSNIAPGLFLRQQMNAVNDSIAKIRPEIRPSLTHDSPYLDKRYFATLVEQHSNYAQACYTVESSGSDAGPVNPLALGSDGKHNAAIASLLPMIPLGEQPSLTTVANSHIFSHTVYQRAHDRVSIVCALHCPFLPTHEALLIDRISSELRMTLLQPSDIDSMNHQLADIRHTLRAGLEGLTGASASIVQRYKLAQGLDKDDGYKELLVKARFRKDIERLRGATTEIRSLFESVRIMVDPGVGQSIQLMGTDVVLLLKERIQDFREETARRGISIVFNVRGHFPPEVPATKPLMTIIVFNLIDNAVKYSHQDEIVRITLEADKDYWTLEVENTGQYIAPDRYLKIFEPFERLRPAKGQASRPGTGLGLPAVKRALQLLSGRGTIQVRSLPLITQGEDVAKAKTTFLLRMPRARE